MISCAVLDLVERANGYWLRCKFPEFAKFNLLLLVAGSLIPLRLFLGNSPWPRLLACLVGGLAAVKLLDIALSRIKGLAIAVVAFSIANAVLFWFLALALVPAACSQTFSPGIAQMREVLIRSCAHVHATLVGIAIMALVLTLLLYSQDLYRGIKDIGFVGASLSGERRRRQGI